MTAAGFKNEPLLTPEQLQARLGEFYAAIAQFNDGYYFESHETLEDLWMVTPVPERDMFQAVIQIAAAFVHYARGEYPGIVKLLDAAADKLRPFAPERLDIDIAMLLAGVVRARDEIAALGPEHFMEWDESHMPRIDRKEAVADGRRQ
jgi:predicted metal-dependent hydrolase